MAALFIGVTMAFPMGLAGLWESHVVPWWARVRASKKGGPEAPVAKGPRVESPVSNSTLNGATKLPPGISGQRV